MRKLSTRVFSFVLALMLCVSVVCGSANKVSAAEVPSLSISPLVTSSVNSQAFQVQVSADATYGAYIDGALLDSGTLTAGSHTLSFNTSGDVFLDVYITYTDENGQPMDCAYDSYTITNTKIPATGDHAPLTLWAAMFTASSALLLMMLKRRRKEN